MRVKEAEQQTIKVLREKGKSSYEIATIMGLDPSTIRRHLRQMNVASISKVKVFPAFSACTEEDMHKIFDLDKSGVKQNDIASIVGKSNATVYNVINRYYESHKSAYATWLQKQTEAPSVQVTPATLHAIREARERVQNQNEQEESRALVMEVQTVEPEQVKPSCNHQVIIDTQREIIEKQKVIIANHEETINLLKEHIQLLKSLR